jgi:hypothetical protein
MQAAARHRRPGLIKALQTRFAKARFSGVKFIIVMTTLAHQFTSLRAFVPRFAQHPCSRNGGRASWRKFAAPGGVELLREAQQLQLPSDAIGERHGDGPADLDSVPPYHEWHQHAELLQG